MLSWIIYSHFFVFLAVVVEFVAVLVPTSVHS